MYCILLVVLYFSIGLGVAKLIAQVKNRNISFVEFLFWPCCAIIYAICDDIN